jgi:hypothetical protein
MHEAEPTCIVEIVHVQDFDLFHSCIGQYLFAEAYCSTYTEVAC